MPITDFLERNAREYPNDICLVEIKPEIKEDRRVTWKEYELIEPSPKTSYRREITWSVFNEKANRFANLLLQRGIKKGDKVAILMMNGLEWLPIYFSSGTTGSPKAILHKHRSLVHSCKVEQNHHNQQKDDVFLCIPPLYHTGVKMHWFGSLLSGSKAVLLKGTAPRQRRGLTPM